NDEKTLRKDGAKTDVYATFLRMLKSGTVPNSWAELEKAANDLPEVG
ncbi:type II toxin-antitoxin system YhaV family toxin, partial [Vibrio breoganii]